MSDAVTKSFFRPGKLALLILLGAFVYAAALVVFVPAGWVWQKASPHVRLPGQVQVRQVSGKLWDGAAGVVLAGYPVRVDWQLGWPSSGQWVLPVDFHLDTSQSSLRGSVNLGWPGQVDVEASGRIGVAEFRDLIRKSGGAMIEGDVVIDRLRTTWADNRVTEADGHARWAGGRVTWPMGNQTGSADFPPMDADLSTTDGGVALTVAQQGGTGPAADASLLWNGMMEIRVYKRMVDLAGQPWSESARPGDVVFRVRQPLVPGGL
ncbi:type II secretion system protein N [Marinobacter koreensis]|jgi:general secretion pathway protein N|uniref:Type II secretion system protein N n=2 Tax=Marinobacter koreensis TaxID=335974 RepID=A0ABW0RKD3_9GAMM|nr:type II secretion system protein N [Marinobacter koreensis]MCK7547038.1 type II secretion system protein N [Marinobacter koreensis]